MRHRFRFTVEQENKIVERYLNKEASGKLCKEYECDRKTITEIAKRHGKSEYVSLVKGGRNGINTSHLNNKIVELHSGGKSQQVIGDFVGISQSVVSRVLRQLGLKPNNILRSKKREESNFWKGGKIIKEGYVYILSNEFPSMQNKTGYISEHRLVMARHIGRALNKNETVHHVNGIRSDNIIENLQLRKGKHGKGVIYKCANCGSHNIVEVKITED